MEKHIGSDPSGKSSFSRSQCDSTHHCLTCADEAVPVKVVHLNEDLALVEARDQTEVRRSSKLEEIDITLVEDVHVGDILLVHGGVAIAHLEKKEHGL